jgi:hypothetical protein
MVYQICAISALFTSQFRSLSPVAGALMNLHRVLSRVQLSMNMSSGRSAEKRARAARLIDRTRCNTLTPADRCRVLMIALNQ